MKHEWNKFKVYSFSPFYLMRFYNVTFLKDIFLFAFIFVCGFHLCYIFILSRLVLRRTLPKKENNHICTVVKKWIRHNVIYIKLNKQVRQNNKKINNFFNCIKLIDSIYCINVRTYQILLLLIYCFIINITIFIYDYGY